MLIGALSSGVPPIPTQSVPNLTQMPENDAIGDSLIEFHMPAGLVDKTWILFDSGGLARIVVRNGLHRIIRCCL